MIVPHEILQCLKAAIDKNCINKIMVKKQLANWKWIKRDYILLGQWSDICSGDNIAPAMIAPTTKS